MKKITIIRPDDWHCHLRDHVYLARTVTDTALRFERAVIMPNLMPPVVTVAQAKAYYKRIKQYIPHNITFFPLMTLYLTDTMSSEEIRAAKQSNFIVACKLYPTGVTTHSQTRITTLQKMYSIIEVLQSVDLPLLLHGESADPSVDIFDREAVFVEQELIPLIKRFPSLRIVLEHISTKVAVDFITETTKSTLSATITPHHALLTRDHLLKNGLHPHHYCFPVLKTRTDRTALIKAAISGNSKFFLGTDSAPHSKIKKESAYGAAGIYNAPTAIEIYTELFDRYNALDKLEGFSSHFGAQFYQLPLNTKKITLVKKAWKVVPFLPFGTDVVIPFLAGKTLNWQMSFF
ncbi:dihydroorotase [Coxiella endosymbiont of Amblyomma americanum]|uniref:dihydroorotase n=1 Tax=Coxiella endosymbiont of Amblyomma americanum TaxID=325775 RepID=UPI00057E571B|nr:dihydroorotase [Coxiella endosymbiont of Amblyomma americanum]AJC50217.1 dihydroorotase [Coxiella endosymbiont of Amblyomma americanum]AUJ58579.1 dihydroorotase [Coxiella-like endosymbiont of Amblyomma americanum]